MRTLAATMAMAAACGLLGVPMADDPQAIQKTGFDNSADRQPTVRPRRSLRDDMKQRQEAEKHTFETPVPQSLPTPNRGAVFVKPLVVENCQVKMAEIIHLPSEIAGMLVKMNVEEGSVVKRGDVIASLDDKLAKLERELRQRTVDNPAALETAERRVSFYKLDFDRVRELSRKGSAAASDVDRALAQVELSIAERKDAEVKYLLADIEFEKAEEMLKRHVISSPVTGIIVQRLKHAGEAVQQLEPIVHILRTDRVKIVGQVDSRTVDHLKRGMVVESIADTAVRELLSLVHSSEVNAVRLADKDRKLVFGAQDGKVVVVDLATGKVERELAVSSREIRTIATCAAEPNQVWIGGDDGSIRFWNFTTGQEVRPAVKATAFGSSQVLALAVHPENPNRGWSGHADGRIHEWDFAKGEIVRSLQGITGEKAHINPVTCLELSPDRQLLMSVGDDNAVRLWHVANGEMKISFDKRSASPQAEVRQMNFSPNGAEVPFNSDALLQFRRINDGLPTDEIESPTQNFASSVMFAPAAGLVLAVRVDGEIQLWRRAVDGRPPRLARAYRGHRTGAGVNQMTFSENGQFFASCGEDRTVRFWKIPDLKTLDAERHPATVTYVSPEAGASGFFEFHAEVDNRSGIFRGNTTATVVIYPD